jgi:hypothetical protein
MPHADFALLLSADSAAVAIHNLTSGALDLSGYYLLLGLILRGR